DAPDDGLFDTRILIQPQETVGTEVDDLSASDANFPVVPYFLDHHVFKMAGRKQLGIMFNKSDERATAQDANQLLHGKGSHFLNSLREIRPRRLIRPSIGKPDQTTNFAHGQSQSEDAEAWQPLQPTAVDRGSDLQYQILSAKPSAHLGLHSLNVWDRNLPSRLGFAIWLPT